jgi:hypothetical protein
MQVANDLAAGHTNGAILGPGGQNGEQQDADAYDDAVRQEGPMAKGRRLETTLTKLVERVAPGSIRITVPKFALETLESVIRGLGRANRYEVAYSTRGFEDSFHGSTIRQAVEAALNSLERPDGTNPDPFLPRWYQLTRYQREVVRRTIEERVAHHMATAAALKIANKSDAETEWKLADAFRAALDSLEYADVDDQGRELPNPPLGGENRHRVALSSAAKTPSKPRVRKKKVGDAQG